MAWDPALLRKYNATGHFRLLNQVRSELKEQPIQRPLVTSRVGLSRGSGGRSESRNTESRSPESRPADFRQSDGRASEPRRQEARSTAGRSELGRSSSGGSGRRRSSASSLPPAPVAHDPIVMVPVLTDAFPLDSYGA